MKLMNTEVQVRQVASVSRALQIIELLISTPMHELGVSEIARQLGVVKSTAHQLLATLASHGFVENNGTTGRYRLGVRAMEAGAVASTQAGLGPAVIPLLEALVNEVHETCSIGVLVGNSVSLVQRVEAESVLRVDLKVGTRFPVETSAIGRIILAVMPEERRIQTLDALDLSPTERRQTEKAVQIARRDGCAIVRNIPVEGISAMAVAVRTSEQAPVAGLVVAAPTFRFNPDALRGALTRTAAMIAARAERRPR
jgi:DNA-binding IclR family transcriptional regulator